MVDTETTTASMIAATEMFQTLLETACRLEEKKIRQWRAELRRMPEGSLYLYAKAGKTYYEHAKAGNRRSITTDEALVYRLARKKYLQLRINDYTMRFERRGKKLKVKTTAAQKPLRQLLRRYATAGLDIRRITYSREQYQWVTEGYRSNPVNPAGRRYQTLSGVRVRSKSEQSIGNELELSGIPYRYEPMIQVDVSWMQDMEARPPGRYKTYFPDFVILTATGECIIWEHLGRVHEGGYRVDNAERISAFRQSGQFREDQLILTFEADMKETGFLQDLIARRVLPYI